MSLELVPLATARVGLRPGIVLPNTPAGTRMIIEVTSFEIVGERIRAHMMGVAAADWAVVSPDGSVASLDVRVTMETDDGALIYGAYQGRLNMTETPLVVYTAPRFDTGDERYTWLNPLQLVAKGILDADLSGFEYEIYELR